MGFRDMSASSRAAVDLIDVSEHRLTTLSL